MTRICLLGCGGTMPLPERYLTSLLLSHNGKMLLMDCGEGTQVSLKIAKWGFKAIDGICITHFHADHIAGIPGMLLTIGNSGRQEPLFIIGPKGTLEVMRGLSVIFPKLPYELQIVEMDEEKNSVFTLGDFHISSLPVDHGVPCISYSVEIKRGRKFDPQKAKSNSVPMKLWSRLQKDEEIEFEGKVYSPDMVLGDERKGLKISYCTDTRPVDGLSDFLNESDLLVCEGMYGDNENMEKAIENGHMTFSEAASLAKDSDSRELWLTHYSPSLTSPQDFLKNATDIFENTKLGEDRLITELNFE